MDTNDANPLPDNPVLDLDAYAGMLSAAGHETRLRILYALDQRDEASATELADALDVPSNRLHYHLDKLTDAGIVANRLEKERGADGLYSYYMLNSLGGAILHDGIDTLLTQEHEMEDRYSD